MSPYAGSLLDGMPMCADLPWDPGLSASVLRPPFAELGLKTQVVYIISRTVEFVELGNCDLEQRLSQLRSLILRG